MAAETAEATEPTHVEDEEGPEDNGFENGVSKTAEEGGEGGDVSNITRAVRNLSTGTDDLRVSADHVALMNSAIDRLCKRPVKLSHIPRAGETAAVEAYTRIVRKAISEGENDNEVQEKLIAAGVQEDQAKAAIAALRIRMDEVRWVVCFLHPWYFLGREIIAGTRKS